MLSLLAHSFLVLCSILNQIKVHKEFRLSYGNMIPSALRPFVHTNGPLHMETAPWTLAMHDYNLQQIRNYYPLSAFHVLYHISTVYLIQLEQVFSTTKSTKHYPEEIWYPVDACKQGSQCPRPEQVVLFLLHR